METRGLKKNEGATSKRSNDVGGKVSEQYSHIIAQNKVPGEESSISSNTKPQIFSSVCAILGQELLSNISGNVQRVVQKVVKGSPVALSEVSSVLLMQGEWNDVASARIKLQKFVGSQSCQAPRNKTLEDKCHTTNSDTRIISCDINKSSAKKVFRKHILDQMGTELPLKTRKKPLKKDLSNSCSVKQDIRRTVTHGASSENHTVGPALSGDKSVNNRVRRNRTKQPSRKSEARPMVTGRTGDNTDTPEFEKNQSKDITHVEDPSQNTHMEEGINIQVDCVKMENQGQMSDKNEGQLCDKGEGQICDRGEELRCDEGQMCLKGEGKICDQNECHHFNKEEHNYYFNTKTVCEKGFLCQFCGKEFRTRRVFRQHVRDVHTHTEKKISCDRCEKLFKNNRQLGVHKKRVHQGKKGTEYPFLGKNIQGLHVCPKCSFTHRSKGEVFRHMRRHHPDVIQTFKCDNCSAVFSNQSRLDSHVNSKHVKNEDTKKTTGASKTDWVCDRCSKVYSSASNLLKHQRRMHEKQRDYKCDICNRAFFNLYRCEEHKRRHLSKESQMTVASFPCKYCGKKFTSKRYCTIHEVKVHQKESFAIECGDCGKRFSHPSQLKVHSVQHGNIQPTICAHCGKVYTHPYILRKHQRIAHKIRVLDSLCANENSAVNAAQEKLQTEQKDSQDLTPSEVSLVEENFPDDPNCIADGEIVQLVNGDTGDVTDVIVVTGTGGGTLDDDTVLVNTEQVLPSGEAGEHMYWCQECNVLLATASLMNEHLLSHQESTVLFN